MAGDTDFLLELPQGWSSSKLGAVADVTKLAGYEFTKYVEYDDSGEIMALRALNVIDGRLDLTSVKRITKAVSDALPRSKLHKNDILLTYTGSIGQVAVIDKHDKYHLAPNVCRLRVNGEANVRFVFSFLRSSIFKQQLSSFTVGSTQPTIPMKSIREIALPLPPLAEQKAIASILGALDDKIELNRRMNATLEGMARALFQSWFVDFDPVRAKLDGRKPEGMDKATAALFPEHFAHGKHDMLPVGWSYSTIEEISAINAWTLGKNDDLETLEYIEISEVSRGNIGNIATYSRGEEPSRARRRLRQGDTIISTVRPDRGSYFLALNPPENRVASTGFAVLTPTKVPWSFLHAALTQPEVSDHLGQMADGGAYPAVRPEIIGAMQVAVPDELKILQAFHRTSAPLFEQAEANRIQSRTLATLRDTLLPKLLSGELSVASIPKVANDQ